MTFFIAVLAAWNITSIIHDGEIFKSIRIRIGVYEDGSYNDTWLAGLVSCFWCLSVWVGLLVTVLLLIFPLALYPFALSALAWGLERATNKWMMY